jgi:hypothetical protein
MVATKELMMAGLTENELVDLWDLELVVLKVD